jgi:hypothetical protein
MRRTRFSWREATACRGDRRALDELFGEMTKIGKDKGVAIDLGPNWCVRGTATKSAANGKVVAKGRLSLACPTA